MDGWMDTVDIQGFRASLNLITTSVSHVLEDVYDFKIFKIHWDVLL